MFSIPQRDQKNKSDSAQKLKLMDDYADSFGTILIYYEFTPHFVGGSKYRIQNTKSDLKHFAKEEIINIFNML